MKDRSQIENRIRRLVQEGLDRRLKEADVILPHKCRHNHRQPLDHRKTIDGEPNPHYNRIAVGEAPVAQTIGLCMLNAKDPSEWNGTICEDPIDAKRCPYFDPKEPKEAVYQEYVSNLEDEDWRREHMPEVASLLWVLGTGLALLDDYPKVSVPIPGFWDRLKSLFRPRQVSVPQLPVPEGDSADVRVYIPSLYSDEDHPRENSDG